jgi:HEAT repeat protein
MADTTLKKLVHLIGAADDAELRRAAVLVAAAVGSPGERELVKGLLAVLDEGDPPLRHAAIDALGELGADAALPALVKLVQHGGDDLEAAARAAGRLGKRGAKAMTRLMAEAAPLTRRRIAAALAHGGTDSATLASIPALLDPDPGVVNAAASSLASELPRMGNKQRQHLTEHLLDLLKGKSRPALSPASEAAIVRILGGLHAPEAEAIYWACLEPGRPTALRAVALQALGTLPLPSSDRKLQKLLECAADPDFQIVAPALLILKQMPLAKKAVKHWLRLLDAPDVAARRLAVEKVRELDSAEVARALVAQLRHPDRALQNDALAALRGSRAGRQALLEALLEAPTAEEAWALARAEKEVLREMPPAQRARLFAQACRYQDEEDRRADALWFLLRETDHDRTLEQIEERAEALRKKKEYARSLAYLRLLTRDPACGSALRFEQAAVGLKVSAHDTSAVARNANPCLAQFARLLQDTDFDLLGAVGKAKWLDANDLFYLGFHFAGENNKPAREFGGGVLKLLIKRSPRSAVAKNAKAKLKSEGFD